MDKLHRPDNVLTTLVEVGRLTLVLLGLIGLAVQIFRDKGWFSQLLSKMLDSPLGVFSVPLALFALYLLNRWITSSSDGKVARGDFPMYLMMAIGAFFLYELITTGGF